MIAIQYWFISTIQQHELATVVHMSSPSQTLFRPSTLSYPSELLQGPSLSSLGHTANFHWLSIFLILLFLLQLLSGIIFKSIF